MGSGARHLLNQALTWLFVGLGIGVFVYYYADIVQLFAPPSPADRVASAASAPGPAASEAAPTTFGGKVAIPRDARGHYRVEAEIDSRPVDFMVDTGASLVVLSYEDADRIGLHPQSLDFSGRAQTANGVSRIAPVVLDRVRVGGIEADHVPAAITERGAMTMNLLGMSFLNKLGGFEVQGDQLVLTR